MKKYVAAMLLSTSMLVTLHSPAWASTESGKAVATVNGKEISLADVTQVLQKVAAAQRLKETPPFDALKEEQKMAVIKEVAAQKLLADEVEKSKIAKEDDVKKQLAQLQAEVLQNALLAKEAKKAVTDTAVKARYDQLVTELKGKEELRASHILVATEAEAKKISAELAKKPDSFAQLAKTKSLDSSKQNGGDLGYFLVGAMVPEFEKATLALKKGEISKPVQTQFGWHIIKLQDKRVATIPTFDQAKGRIQQELASKAVDEFVKGLLDKAQIKVAGQ